MTDPAAANALAVQRLVLWLSAAFPTGAFAWSGGLEAAALEPEELRPWLETSLARGPLWNDAVLCAAAHRGEDVDDLAFALAGSRTRRDELQSVGEGFRAAVRPWARVEATSYPAAVGKAARGIPAAAAIAAFLQSAVANQVACAQRLMRLGQTVAMQLLRDLEPAVAAAAARAAASTTDDLGGCALGMEMAAMRHETLSTRIFRS